jgi:hypothetical protein
VIETSQRGRRASELPGDVAEAQAVNARPPQDDRDHDSREPCILRRRYELVDRVHKPQMINGGGAVIVPGVGKRLEIVARVMVIRCPVPGCRVDVVIRAAVEMVIHAGFAFNMLGPAMEIGAPGKITPFLSFLFGLF